MENEPSNPIAAVTHPEPYGYYARLVADRPLYYEPSLGLWVASSAAAVAGVLTSPACRVRPADEPVPRALLGSPAGEIFRHLVRMSDGEAHHSCKRAVSASLESLDTADVLRQCELSAAELCGGIVYDHGPERLTELALALPVHVVGSLLGLADETLAEATRLVSRFVRCLAPGSTPEQVEEGKRAAGPLRDLVRRSFRPGDGTLLGRFALHAGHGGGALQEPVLANAIGFLTQAYEATAGLLANTLLALAREPETRARVAGNPGLLGAVVDEVLRHDSPVQNTRRFVAAPVAIEGRRLQPGEAVLVVLAAANRDPAAHVDPHRFYALRRPGPSFTFGACPHSCPGRALATAIARAGVARLLTGGLDPDHLERRPRYRPSANSRIPLLRWSAESAGDRR